MQIKRMTYTHIIVSSYRYTSSCDASYKRKAEEEAMSKAMQLSAKWQLDAALLSRPVDLTPLVTMSQTAPEGNGYHGHGSAG